MKRKLDCILVDDDPAIHDIFRNYLSDSEYAELTHYYEDPREFIKANKKPDLVFIDIVMPHMDGFTFAQTIKPIPVILFTGKEEYFKDIMNMLEPIDAFPKPIVKERLLKAVKKAYLILNAHDRGNRYELFDTNEGRKNLLLSDILFVRTIKNSHRFLEVYLKGGRKIVIKGYSLEYISNIAGLLLQSNRSELVSPEAIDLIEHRTFIKMRGVSDNGKPLHSIICRTFHQDFLAGFNSI
jgi:two-component system LytT family response regulator